VSIQQEQKYQFYKQGRENKLDNLFRQKPYLENNPTFNNIRTRFQENTNTQFPQFSAIHYEQLKANVKYVQWCSGLNVQEFCAVFNLGHSIISNKENRFSHNIRQHTFLKICTAFLIYLLTIELFDIFRIEFPVSFPFLRNLRKINLMKLGKKEWISNKIKTNFWL